MHDSSGRLVVASEQAAVLLGFKGPDTLIGRPALFEEGCAIGEDGAPLSPEHQPAAIALRTGTDVTPIRIGLLAAAGDVRWFDVEAKPLFRVGAARPYAAVSRLVSVRPRTRAKETSALGSATDRSYCYATRLTLR
jgi:hypothetical protein